MRKKTKKKAKHIKRSASAAAKGRHGDMVAPTGGIHQPLNPQNGDSKEDPEFVCLNPGVETEIVKLLPSLPGNVKFPQNARLRKLEAELKVEKYQLKQKAGVREDGQEPRTFTVSVEEASLPKNVTVKLEGGGEVFWFGDGELAEKNYSIPDFAEHVNAYLDECLGESDQVRLKFLVKSDTSGKVRITIKQIAEGDYALTQLGEFAASPYDDTPRSDRDHKLDYCTIISEGLNANPLPDYPDAILDTLEMDITGEFGEERLLGSVAEHDGRAFAKIDKVYSLAQKIEFEAPLKCVGISGHYKTEEEAELYVEIQQDMRGSPADESPVTKANLRLVPPPDNNGNAFRAFAAFETPVELNAETPYWIIIKGVTGNAQLGLKTREESYLGEILVNRGGQLWRAMCSGESECATAALIRIVYLPETDNRAAAVEIGIEGTHLFEKFDPGPEAETVVLNIEDVDITTPSIVVKSHAQGTLKIVNVIKVYSPEGKQAKV
jgi:hypothetical protein